MAGWRDGGPAGWRAAKKIFRRMSALVANEDVANTVRPRSLPVGRRELRLRTSAVRPLRVPLQQLEVRDLTTEYTTGGGVRDVSFTITKGSFTVLTGPIGSGKSTLLRALLGLTQGANSTGQVLWNGSEVSDRAAFFVPPNAAYLPQVPQLISDSVADNITLGELPLEALLEALDLAAVRADIDEMPEGTATMIGPRGLRLSGGQRQRVATARAVVHAPELVVLDDLSSALDVETELELWSNLAAAGMTVLAVSHRAVAIDRADQVLRLEAGRLVEYVSR